MNGETTINGMTILSRSQFVDSFKGMGGASLARHSLARDARVGQRRWSSQWIAKGEVGKSRSLLLRYKGQLHSLSLPEKEAAVGLMLGDASLQTQDGGRTHRLKLLQGEKNRLYLCHLNELFSDWILSHRPPSIGSQPLAGS